MTDRPPAMLRVPERDGTCGPEIVEVARTVDIELDDHQQLVMDVAGSELESPIDGRLRWAGTQVGWSEPRQNGKSLGLLARTVAGVLLFEEPRIIHSAHEVKTAMESFLKLKAWCTDYDVLRKRVKRITNVNGRESIDFLNGTNVSFMARTTGSGRGFSASTILLDEAQQLSFAVFAAILPTLSAVPNSQVWLCGTPPSPEMNGEVFTRLRKQAREGHSPRLAWVEWGAYPTVGEEDKYDYSDRANWLRANPACPERIDIQSIEDEFNAMDEETFRRDRLGEWDSDSGATIVPISVWNRQKDVEGKSVLKQALSIDVSPNRSRTSISLAGYTDASLDVRHVEVLAQGPGVDWALPFVRDIVYNNEAIRAVIVDAMSPAASLIEPLETHYKVRCTKTQTRDMAMACGQMYDAFMAGKATHSGQPELTSAMEGSMKRTLLDSWALSRKRSEVDITAFTGATLALYGASLKKVKSPRFGRRGQRRVSVA